MASWSRAPTASTPSRVARRARRAAVLALIVGSALACGERRPAADAALPAVREGRPLHLVVLGDSLAAGHGVGPSMAFPSLLVADLQARGLQVVLANQAISGASASHGHQQLARVPFARIDLALLELGANDALRGRPADAVASELLALVDALRDRGARVALLGVDVPALAVPAARRGAYQALWNDVAQARGLPVVPSLLDDVLGRPERMLPDRAHPNVFGQRLLADKVLALLDEQGWLGAVPD